MKSKVIFTILFLSICIQKLFSQSIDVSIQKLNVFFAGCGEEVKIQANKLDPFALELVADNGSVQKLFTKNSLQYQIDTMKDKTHAFLDYSVNFAGGMINHKTTLSVHYTVSGIDSIVWQKDFYVLQLPNPTVFIGDTVVNGKMTRDDFLKQYNLGVYIPSFPLLTVWFIESYDVQYLPPDGNFKTFHIEKNIFSTELRNQMQAAKSGDTFIFKNIKVDGTDQYSRTPNTVKVEII